MAPRFLGGKSENRREQLTQRVENLMHDYLCRTPTRRICRVAIHPVFRDVDVEATQINGAKLVECVVDLVEFEGFVSGSTIANHLLKPLQNPTVNHCCTWHR